MSENDDRNKLLGLEKQAREKAAKQAQADLKERVAFHKVQKKENEEKLKAEKCFALGECGLDKITASDFELQKEVFKKQIQLSEKYKKPLIIH